MARSPARKSRTAYARQVGTPAGAIRQRVGDAAVMRATGRSWNEWLTVLDRAGARTMPHKDIALMLSRQFAVPLWWSQTVTVGYEQARGLRLPGQKADGYSVNASRTLPIEVGRLYDAWKDPKARARWLREAPVQVRHSTDGRSLRMTWTAGGSAVDVNFVAKEAGRSQVQVEHRKLADPADARRQKAFWSEALDRLKAFLEAKP